jgi:8-oxo-dGTP pyrophosphatase MutT (NUDIX family)
MTGKITTTKQVLEEAANIIEKRGWVQKDWETTDGAVCAFGAMRHAAYGCLFTSDITNDHIYFEARKALEIQVHKSVGDEYYSVPQWNDQKDQTKDNVVKIIRLAAQEYKEEPKAFGASVLIQKDGLILAIARRKDPNDWALVGGKVDANETEKEAAIRECKEECGLKIWNLKEIIRRSVGNDTGVTFSCEYEGEPSTQEGEPECKWVKPEVLTTGVFGEYNKALLIKLGLLTEVKSK